MRISPSEDEFVKKSGPPGGVAA